MTDRLRTLLHEAAESAGNYVQADHATAPAHHGRFRRPQVLAPLTALSLVLIIVAAFVAVPLLTGSEDPGAAPTASASYPRVVTPPAKSSPLPSEPVGVASFIYSPCIYACDPLLVTPTGVQYALPQSPRGEPTASYTLSPDGRWLGDCDAEGCRLRDLEHTDSRKLRDQGTGRSEIWAWSSNGKWLLLVRHVDGVIKHLEAINLATGEDRPVIDPTESPLVITDDGALIYATPGVNGPRLVTADISSGKLVPRAGITVQAHSQLRNGESVSAQNLSLRLVPDSDLAALDVVAQSPGETVKRPTAILLVNRTNGHVVRRLPVPPSNWNNDAGVWETASAQPKGILLIHSAPDHTQIVRLDLTTGKRTVLSTLPQGSLLVLRGTNRA